MAKLLDFGVNDCLLRLLSSNSVLASLFLKIKYPVLRINGQKPVGDNLTRFILDFKLNYVAGFCQNQYFL